MMRRLQCVRRKRRGPWALRQTERKSLQSADLNSGSSSAASLHKPFHSPAVNRETHYDSVSYQKTYGLRWTGSPGKPISSFTLPKRCHKLCRKPVANSQVVSIRRSGWYRRNHPQQAECGLSAWTRVRRSGWYRRNHPGRFLRRACELGVSVDQVGTDVITEGAGGVLERGRGCPSIRLVPT